ncbi:hypothetical protein [Pseudonocardia abyssalis]|uniref:Uncharacterized protein n=1 Tax=Pseudonocardia abyssalis TaxID=2792008 RepID=A0ABS6UMI7_9PSEU|nr:hypothetical protein [Pseudonocardia abyssalis]MBW0119547.1 hypothetical protein [Pseudonocardia abyssalis]MBW0133123.1 hypothetical protein [Pseudonocardia abyssalis]
MTWQPENGWPWLAGRWAVAAGAGALLGGAVWLGEPGPDRTLALEPTTVREVELDPREQAELSSLVPDADPPDAPAVDTVDEPDEASDGPDADAGEPDRDAGVAEGGEDRGEDGD